MSRLEMARSATQFLRFTTAFWAVKMPHNFTVHMYRWLHARPLTNLAMPDFHETHKCPTALCAGLLYQISPKSVNKREEYVQKAIHILNWSLAFTAPISPELMLAWQIFVNSLHPKFHKNQTVQSFILVTDGQTDGHGVHIHLYFLLHEKFEKTSNFELTLRWLMSYIYGAPILDVSRSHTTTQHSR